MPCANAAAGPPPVLPRLRQAGIPAPAPLLLRLHVLVMEFIGEAGVAAPRLKVRRRIVRSLAAVCCAPASAHGALPGRRDAVASPAEQNDASPMQRAHAHVRLRSQDAGLPLAKLCAAYQQLVTIVRRLYQVCRLVHADLSEYNILVHKVRACGVQRSR